MLTFYIEILQVTAALVRQGYTRDTRRSFCPRDTWLSDRVKIQADGVGLSF